MRGRRSLAFGGVSIRSVIPNLITLLAFIAGLSSIRFALSGNWALAASLIVAAGILDGLDGSVARLLKSASKFGAELDSLSDNVAFGVAPALLVYLWSLQDAGRLGWAVAVLYAVAMALRLARFNAGSGPGQAQRQRLGYLTGIPAPAAAGLLLSPLWADLAFDTVLLQARPYVVAVYTALLSCLVVSTMPTFSPRMLRLRRDFLAPLMLGVTIVLAGFFVRPWLVMLAVAVLYLASLPVSSWAYRRRRRQKRRG